MSDWAKKYAESPYVTDRGEGLVTFGATEPILPLLEELGFSLHNLFCIGLNNRCGSLIVEKEERARLMARALQPYYSTTVALSEEGDWEVVFDVRDEDGVVPNNVVRKLTLKNGKTVIRNGRFVA